MARLFYYAPLILLGGVSYLSAIQPAQLEALSHPHQDQQPGGGNVDLAVVDGVSSTAPVVVQTHRQPHVVDSVISAAAIAVFPKLLKSSRGNQKNSSLPSRSLMTRVGRPHSRRNVRIPFSAMCLRTCST
jgi:hypothetical protein